MSRTPLSKQRNKYIQRVLVEAPSWRPGRTTIWPWFMKQRTRKGMAIEPRLPELGRWSRICSPWIGDNGISCLRKLTGAQLHRNRRLRKRQDYTALGPPGPASCRLSDEDQTPEVLSELFQDWQRTHTQSSVMVPRDLRQRMDVRFCEGRNHRREAQVRAADPGRFAARSSNARLRRSVFSLDKDLYGGRQLGARTVVRSLARVREWRIFRLRSSCSDRRYPCAVARLRPSSKIPMCLQCFRR